MPDTKKIKLDVDRYKKIKFDSRNFEKKLAHTKDTNKKILSSPKVDTTRLNIVFEI